MRSIEVEFVRVQAKPGAYIGESIKDSLAISIAENRKVLLLHNEREYTCDPDAHFNLIYQTAKPPLPEPPQ